MAYHDDVEMIKSAIKVHMIYIILLKERNICIALSLLTNFCFCKR